MDDVNKMAEALAERCDGLKTSAEETLGWLRKAEEGSIALQQGASYIDGEMRRIQNAAYRLGRAASRRMCVGVYGPSRAGKSYLVNSLARGSSSSFMVDVGGRAYDFLLAINPQNEGGESTGLVTRFTANPRPTQDSHPVFVRLFNELDLVKILVNSCQRDIVRDQENEFEIPGVDEIRTVLDDLGASAGAVRENAPSASGIYDLREYVLGTFENAYRDVTACGYWTRAAELAPCLSLNRRATLYAVLWGMNEDFTALFLHLAEACERLGGASEALCSLDAIIDGRGEDVAARHPQSILNVSTLFMLGKEGTSDLELTPLVDGKQKAPVRLPRPIVTALVAEMELALGGTQFDFFENADLLDFPGVRGRLRETKFKRKHVEAEASDAEDASTHNSGALFFLRGKVDYLFQRYEAERELTAILLVIGSEQLNVAVLGDMVDEWVCRTLGASPEARADNPNTLFLVMNKFDNEFSRSSGQDDESQSRRFDGRIQQALLDYWERRGWAVNWSNGEPFKNCFWLRNPAALRPDLMEIDSNNREQGIRNSEQPFIDKMRSYCIQSDLVRRHMEEPGRAFDEALRANDGGVTYLVEKLSAICTKDMKIRQIAARLDEEVERFDHALRPYFDDVDGDQRAERDKAAKRAVQGLRNCVGGQRFAELLSVLQLSQDDIWPLHNAASTVSDDPDAGEADAAATASATAASDLDDIFGGFSDDEEPASGAEASGGTGAGKPATRGPVRDRAYHFSDKVLQSWTEKVLRLTSDEIVLQRLLVTSNVMGDVAQELAKGAERLNLREDIAADVRDESRHANAQWDQVGPRVVSIAYRKLADYVDWLGASTLPAERRPKVTVGQSTKPAFDDPPEVEGGLSLPEEAPTTTQRFIVDWLHAFRHLAVENADFSDGGVLRVEDNDALGRLLAHASLSHSKEGSR